MRSKFVLLGSLYVSQYLGISFIFAAVPAIFRASGTALEDLAWIYGLGLIWSLKFLWAPLVDRFGSERLGHYRGWLLLTQSLLFATLTGTALLDLHDDLAFLFSPARGVDDASILYAAISLMLLAWAANATIAATLMMDKSDPTRAETDYTLQYSISSLFSHLLGASALGLAGAIGFAGVLAVGAVAFVAIWRYDGFEPAIFASPAGSLEDAGIPVAAEAPGLGPYDAARRGPATEGGIRD